MKELIKIPLKLILISAVTALLLSTVNTFTKGPIAANEEKIRRGAIESVFADMTDSEAISGDFDKSVRSARRIYGGDGLLGYAVETAKTGFNGDIDVMVCFDAGLKILGVKIITISETPSVGMRVNDGNYLSAYNGLEGGITFQNSPVDAISGATISSRAVLGAVNAAADMIKAYAESEAVQ